MSATLLNFDVSQDKYFWDELHRTEEQKIVWKYYETRK